DPPRPSLMPMITIALTVNGEPTEAAFAPYKTLLEVLREDLNLCGTKHGCELGECGACAVLLDGRAVLSCLVLGVDCEGRRVTTVEGLAADGRLHPLQDAFADLGAAQCGYCTPGFLVTAKALLDDHPHPTRNQIRDALSGNLCRCTGYQQIFEAVEAAIDATANARLKPSRSEGSALEPSRNEGTPQTGRDSARRAKASAERPA
ncbi:MAG TPA: (2Fe-2S)-binding protein, partial [Vicinamibacterales bacterium]|nr:(2Fe-2S)-binding protein [Vicinamibacterales bacterium]